MPLPRVLDQALRSPDRRSPSRQHRDQDADNSHGRGQSPVGCSPNPWRAREAGIDVAERTVSRLISKRRTAPSQSWRTFLANHARDLVSIDFSTVPTAGLRVFFVFVVLAQHRRRVVHFNVTEHPTAMWAAQQIVDAFPDDSVPSYLLRDRDSVSGGAFRQARTSIVRAGRGFGHHPDSRGRCLHQSLRPPGSLIGSTQFATLGRVLPSGCRRPTPKAPRRSWWPEGPRTAGRPASRLLQFAGITWRLARASAVVNRG
jgi:hypothetical protein